MSVPRRQVGAEGAELTIGGAARRWRDGRAFVFDDSFEHEVRNDTDRPRVVLLARFWHPDLDGAEAADAALARCLAAREDAHRLRCEPPP